jgi:hypothetical protein
MAGERWTVRVYVSKVHVVSRPIARTGLHQEVIERALEALEGFPTSLLALWSQRVRWRREVRPAVGYLAENSAP